MAVAVLSLPTCCRRGVKRGGGHQRSAERAGSEAYIKQQRQQQLYACAGSAWLCAGRVGEGTFGAMYRNNLNQAVGWSPQTPTALVLRVGGVTRGVVCCVVCVSDIWDAPGVSWAAPHVGVGGDGGLPCLLCLRCICVVCCIGGARVWRAAHPMLGTLHTSGHSVLCRMTQH